MTPVIGTIERTPWLIGLATLLLACVSCESDPAPSQPIAPRAPDDAVPESVAVTGGRVSLGTQLGRLRSVTEVGPFKIARTPVTVGRYRQCVDAGVCEVPSWDSVACRNGRGIDGPTYSTDEAKAQLPVTCATHDQAARYCQWVGGRLPVAKEWLLAARGPDVRRFAWGDEWPTCERHFRAVFDPETASCCDQDCFAPAVQAVGQHQGGASRAGIEDVLHTSAELLGEDPNGDAKNAVGACRSTACLVTGLVPGAIDSFVPLGQIMSFQPGTKVPELGLGLVTPATSFRCTWGGDA
jgi:hypothetical protein